MESPVARPDLEAQLARLLRSNRIPRGRRSAALLQYLFKCELEGFVPSEEQIAQHVWGRSDEWTTADRIVAVNLNRLNASLARYYEKEGIEDPVVIKIDKRRLIAEYRSRAASTAARRPRNFERPILTAAEAFFTTPEDPVLRCVVTGTAEDVDWYALDGEDYNGSLGNHIPLAESLISKLHSTRRNPGRSLPQSLNPSTVGEAKVREHGLNRRQAAAYGCAALAFYLGAMPFGGEPQATRILRLCEVLFHARRHFNASIMRHVLMQMALPFLAGIDNIDASGALRLGIQLTALLEEIGLYEDAQRCLDYSNKVSHRVGKGFFEPGSVESFWLTRRRAQLHAERLPKESKFDRLIAQAEEHAREELERVFSLHIVKAHRSIRQGTYVSLGKAFESLEELLDKQRRSLAGENVEATKSITVHLSELSLLSSIAACRLKIHKWKSYADEHVLSAKALMRKAGHVLPSEYGTFRRDTIIHSNANSASVLQFSPSELRSEPSEELRSNAALVLKCLDRLHVLRMRL